jgi:type I restriction enzyme S subunit
MDEAIAHTEAVIAKLRQVRTGLMHDLLTRGLDENGHLRDPIAHPEQFQDSPLGRIPKEWTCAPLQKHTFSSAYGPRFPGECYSEQGNVALLRTTDMDMEGRLFLEQMPLVNLVVEAFKPHLLEANDFLISRSGTCGIGAVFSGFRVPVLPGAFLIRFRLLNTLLPEFLRLYVNSEEGARRIRDLAEGGVQKNIRGSALLAHLIPVPSRHEQAVILQHIGAIDAKSAIEESVLGKLNRLKSGLMTDLLTGRVRVSGNLTLKATTDGTQPCQ